MACPRIFPTHPLSVRLRLGKIHGSPAPGGHRKPLRQNLIATPAARRLVQCGRRPQSTAHMAATPFLDKATLHRWRIRHSVPRSRNLFPLPTFASFAVRQVAARTFHPPVVRLEQSIQKPSLHKSVHHPSQNHDPARDQTSKPLPSATLESHAAEFQLQDTLLPAFL